MDEKLLDKALDTITKLENLLVTQGPVVTEAMLKVQWLHGFIGILGGIALLLCGFITLFLVARDGWSNSETRGFFGIVALFLMFVGFCVLGAWVPSFITPMGVMARNILGI